MLTTWALDLAAWWGALDAGFRFLLLLPLGVAAAGLLADGRDRARPPR